VADREAMDEAISKHAAPPEGAVLTGWVLVAEWATGDGGRALTRLSGAPMTLWAVRGFLHEALYGDWPDPED
jgi:hypothetical protein